MKRLFALTLLACSLYGAQPYTSLAYQQWGPKTVFAGYNNWFTVWPMWAVDVTCDNTTSRCTSPGTIPFAGTELIYLNATTVPTGLFSIYGAQNATYTACNIVGNSIQLCQYGTSTVVTFSTNGRGVTLYWKRDSGCGGNNVWFTGTSGLPASSTVTYYWSDFVAGINSAAPVDTGSGKWFDSCSLTGMALKVFIPSSAPVGNYSFVITTADDSGGTNSTTFTFPITVVAPPAIVQSSPSSIPALPSLTTWNSTITNSASTGQGAFYCAPNGALQNPSRLGFGSGGESQIWYYDISRTFGPAADWTGDDRYRKCAIAAAAGYLDWITAVTMQQYKLYGELLYFGWTQTGDGRYKAAIQNYLNADGSMMQRGGVQRDYAIREVAYTLELYNVAEAMGMSLTSQANQGVFTAGDFVDVGEPRAQMTAEFLMGMLLSYQDGTTGRWKYDQYQVFMIGLAMDSLIKYWERHHDPRVPYVIKATVDLVWNQYDAANHRVLWNPDSDPPGFQCSNGALSGGVTPWFSSELTSNCNIYVDIAKLFHNFVAPAAAWYWWYTSDATYQTRADEWFAHLLDGGPFNGKSFNQAYRWGWDYLMFRSGRYSGRR